MQDKRSTSRPGLRLGLLLWLIGMPGVIGIVLAMVPPLLRGIPGAPPLWVAAGAGILQSALLLAVAVAVGARLAPRVGLGAPVLQALLASRPFSPGRILVAGTVCGMLGGILLLAVAAGGPAEFTALQSRAAIPLAWRILYGGITEELLLRWGVMSALAWLGWRFGQGGEGAPRARWFVIAIVASALLFGAGHLPAVAAQAGALGASLAVYVVAANAVFGLLFGWLFWRFGLEAAILAHALAHLVAYLVRGF